jgi:hypothetical protein
MIISKDRANEVNNKLLTCEENPKISSPLKHLPSLKFENYVTSRFEDPN